MFTRHTAQFTELTAQSAVSGASALLAGDTIVETEKGFARVSDLQSGDKIATLDGGFATVCWTDPEASEHPGYHIPAGVLGNCSDMRLNAGAYVGLPAPAGYDADTEYLSLPISAFEGTRGIRRLAASDSRFFRIGLSSEEMIWTQTGLLSHARPLTDGYFETLSFADARGLLMLDEAGHFDAPLAA